uniref:NADH-ubiquinone oxidoreductase chain 6 n=1 Tax=Lates calcarifer TaxID=8187 RepID=A0A4W6BYR5_LATCA
MCFIMYLILFCFVLGLVAVASNPSPYFAALGLVVVAGMGWMLVVFAYSAALAAEPYPESSWVSVDELGEFSVFRGDAGGVALMYSSGGWMLIISGWVLLLTLFVVLELTRGLSRGALRAV